MRAVRSALAMATLLAVAGCGREHAERASAYQHCTRLGTVVAHADLDGDGTSERIRLIGAGRGSCADSLVTEVGGAVTGADVASLHLSSGRAAVMHLKGSGADLVVLRAGSRPHVFGADGDALGELTVADTPVLPEVHRGTSPSVVTCTPDGGFTVVSATAHKPPGIVLAWDVTRTTYGVRSGTAVRGSATVLARAVADPTLRRQMPELYGPRLLVGCG